MEFFMEDWISKDDLDSILSEDDCEVCNDSRFVIKDIIAMPSEGFDYDDMVSFIGYYGLNRIGGSNVLGGPTVSFFEKIPDQVGYVVYFYSGGSTYIVYKF
jgi:hypothetical protein